MEAETLTLVEFLAEPISLLFFGLFIACCVVPFLEMVWTHIIKYFTVQILNKLRAVKKVTLQLFILFLVTFFEGLG